ncbi:adenine phosphoribosyltransferase [Sinosporangium album]|uniref:Adenine phosphoribosyltransferase n=1 Tax=Sinosporangium album TaxID=504805 RepID=A0A1G8IVW1_9ACTN|nr:adenine phosphoribosyltransferase [Sinosporangium album]SDI23089.1 adenine phosphoribosyltransferase [Sinosporangium album]
MTELTSLILSRIRDVYDYPQPGVLFKDITPLLADPVAFAAVVDELARWATADSADTVGMVDKVVGIEARGFILAAPVACQAGVGFVPVRKKGKLPAETLSAAYDLEYGSATVEVHRDAFAPGDRVLIVDDVLATGGTAQATVELVGRAGAEVVGVAVLMELAFLKGRDRLEGVDLRSLVIV